jgi:hypothetical protein
VTARPWLRHPPATIRQTRTCPTGRPRYGTETAARATSVVLGSSWAIHLTVTACEECGGWHAEPAAT